MIGKLSWVINSDNLRKFTDHRREQPGKSGGRNLFLRIGPISLD